MNSCDPFKNLLVLHAESALDDTQTRQLSEHLETCAHCRGEAEAIAKVRAWLMDPEIFSPKIDRAWQMMPETLTARARHAGSVIRWIPANFGSLGWALSMAAVLALGFGLVWLTHRTEPEPAVAVSAPAPGNDAFLDRIQSAYAREATAQYLSECQNLLLNVMKAEKSCRGDLYDVSLEVVQARQLLQRKRMLDAELQRPAVAHAKKLCDALEGFLVNLSTSDRCESPVGVRRMERFIQQEKLLLRISVLQSELS